MLRCVYVYVCTVHVCAIGRPQWNWNNLFQNNLFWFDSWWLGKRQKIEKKTKEERKREQEELSRLYNSWYNGILFYERRVDKWANSYSPKMVTVCECVPYTIPIPIIFRFYQTEYIFSVVILLLHLVLESLIGVYKFTVWKTCACTSILNCFRD